MSKINETILNDLSELPSEMQIEAIDFIMFLKEKTKKQSIKLNTNGSVIAQMLEQAAQCNLFSKINDPVAWQHEIRQDSLLQGRE